MRKYSLGGLAGLVLAGSLVFTSCSEKKKDVLEEGEYTGPIVAPAPEGAMFKYNLPKLKNGYSQPLNYHFFRK